MEPIKCVHIRAQLPRWFAVAESTQKIGSFVVAVACHTICVLLCLSISSGACYANDIINIIVMLDLMKTHTHTHKNKTVWHRQDEGINTKTKMPYMN